MTNLTEQKQELIEMLEGAIHEEHLRLLDFLLNTQEDIDNFQNHLNTPVDNVLPAIFKHREKKREAVNITEEQFLSLCASDKQQALKQLLQEPISHVELEMLKSANINLSDLYKMATKHMDYMLIPLLKIWDILDKEYEEPQTIKEKLLI